MSTSTNQARSDATRGALLKAARELFSQNGYAETSTPEIVKAANVTRGALYHHFEDKAALFRAVIIEEFQRVSDQITESAEAAPSSPIDALKQGSRGYLTAMKDPGRIRIMLLDGPAVLGQSELDNIDRETSADALRLGLEAAMKAGSIRTLPLDALTIQLSAMFDKAALAVSEGAAAEDHLAVMDSLFDTLAVP